jgi:hypothetical protein
VAEGNPPFPQRANFVFYDLQHVRIPHSTSGDSRTCGPDWAEDTFDRYYTIRPTSTPGVFEVYEQYKNGSFITYEGFSPGACDETDGSPPGVLDANVFGTMHGYILTLVTCDPTLTTCPDPTATCSTGACDTTNGFIKKFFGTAAIRNDETWFFYYAGYDGSNQTPFVLTYGLCL